MSEPIETSTLFVIATPIGNLSDISHRAIEILKSCQTIYAEDTRTASAFLQKIGINGKRIESYHEHSNEDRRAEITRRLTDHVERAALISEAGTPCISDPGYKLVRQLRQVGVSVVAVPGASAFLALSAAAGLPTSRLVFIGFLPHKQAAVRREIASWDRYVGHSLVFFDSMRRLERDLNILGEFYPDVEVAVGRELTKLYEETLTAPLPAVQSWIAEKKVLKGEVSVMVSIADSAKVSDPELLRLELASEARHRFQEGHRLRDLLREYKDRGLGRSELYELLLEVKKTATRVPSD